MDETGLDSSSVPLYGVVSISSKRSLMISDMRSWSGIMLFENYLSILALCICLSANSLKPFPSGDGWSYSGTKIMEAENQKVVLQWSKAPLGRSLTVEFDCFLMRILAAFSQVFDRNWIQPFLFVLISLLLS